MVFFWLTFFIIPLLPTLTPWGISWVVAERYAYLSTLGIVVIVAIFFDWLINKYGKKNENYRYALYGVFAIIILALSIRTIARNIDWKNEDHLWPATERESPSGQNTHNNMGDVYVRAGKYDQAVAEFKKALEINPGYGDAYHNLANTYEAMGQPDMAIMYYKKALSINPNIWQSYQNIGGLYYNKGDYQDALDSLQKAVDLNPTDDALKQNLLTVQQAIQAQARAQGN